ncbi:MAG: methyltransferase [Lewinellaceae bacterium]|nr:methyltransferase [Lewinellaceae bacterium]
MHFVAQDIAEYQPERLDMLIALHACDIATDLALATGIHAQAGIVVAAPCCHKQIRRDMDTPETNWRPCCATVSSKSAAEIVTDGIRALLLEANGYKTNVFEFISTEHTAKNVMITAIGDTRSRCRKKPLPGKWAALKPVSGSGSIIWSGCWRRLRFPQCGAYLLAEKFLPQRRGVPRDASFLPQRRGSGFYRRDAETQSFSTVETRRRGVYPPRRRRRAGFSPQNAEA